ncbi:MAG: inositol monophosphatase [Bacteroidaceae bacterium]|nr:inositol monophosphatase [Bacteroidaceae bacterium]
MNDTELQLIATKVSLTARKAGNQIRAMLKDFDSSRIEKKGAHDYVSYVDKATEQLIVSNLKDILPEAGFLTEEKTTANDQTHPYTWVVDPLDGTTNFLHGVAPYCVAIGLRQGRETLLGVVYEVAQDEMFWAYKGSKAFLNGTPIQVSKTACVNDSLLCFGYPYNVTEWSPVMQRLVRYYYGNCASIRNLGSAETELCYVACGRFDAYVESYLKPWDVCAGAFILQQAGGHISDYAGGDSWTEGQQVLATNGRVHAEMIETLKSVI